MMAVFYAVKISFNRLHKQDDNVNTLLEKEKIERKKKKFISKHID